MLRQAEQTEMLVELVEQLRVENKVLWATVGQLREVAEAAEELFKTKSSFKAAKTPLYEWQETVRHAEHKLRTALKRLAAKPTVSAAADTHDRRDLTDQMSRYIGRLEDKIHLQGNQLASLLISIEFFAPSEEWVQSFAGLPDKMKIAPPFPLTLGMFRSAAEAKRFVTKSKTA